MIETVNLGWLSLAKLTYYISSSCTTEIGHKVKRDFGEILNWIVYMKQRPVVASLA